MQRGRSVASGKHRVAIGACGIALLAAAPLVLAQKPAPAAAPASVAAGTLGRIRDAGRIRIGYRTDARPFSYRDESGQPAGYSVALCQRIADAAKGEPGLSSLTAEWVPLTVGDRFGALQQGQIDLLCGAETVTLERRTEVSFSIPIFPGGIGALVRADAPARLREVLSGRGQTFRPTWRASAAQVLQARAFAAVAGTTSEKWLTERIKDLQVIASVSLVSSSDAGIQALLDRRSDAFFGERAVLLDAARRHASARDLIVLDRLFTYEPLALACGRGDEDFRLFVDRTLSRFYVSGELGGLYTKWFGEPDESALTFFRWNTLTD
jgi:ABC-type amino acid transport substrate-binding protein